MSSKGTELSELIRQAVEALGFELWGYELVGMGRNSTLRVYIDHEKGINLDNCQRVSRQLGAVLDVEDPIPNKYTLEVSSPGVERPLYTAAQYHRYIGEQVQVSMRLPVDGRRKFNGIIHDVNETELMIIEDEKTIAMPFTHIKKAHLVS